MAITGASLQPIYDRLHAVDTYHPMSADTFSDWAMEAGDIVTVSRDGNTITSPVHSMNVVWRGSPQTTINSTGKEERESISRTSKKKYGRGGGGMSNDQGFYKDLYSEDGRLHSELMYTESVLTAEFQAGIESTRADFTSALEFTASHLEVEFNDNISSLHSELVMTASVFQTELTNTASGLSSRITQNANKVAVVVDSNNNIKAAQIVASINGSSSEVAISADHVVLSGNTSINSIMSVSERTVYISAPMRVEGDIMGMSFTTRNGSNSATISDFSDVIKSASVSGNTLTLTPVVGDPIPFNKAVSLSGEWDGTTYSVSATSGTISGSPPTTSVHLQIEGSPNPNETVYAKIYKENPSIPGNVLTTTELELVENASSQVVNLQTATGGLVKGTISTANTYKGGWDLAVGKIGSFSVTDGTGLVSLQIPGSTVGSTDSKTGTITVTQGNWSNGSMVVSAKFDGSQARTTTVSVGSASDWGSTYVPTGKMSVSCKVADKAFSSGEVTDPGYSYGATDGKNAVTLNNPTWTNGNPYTAGSTNTVNVTTSGRPTQLTKSAPVTLSKGAWSNGSVNVDITTTNGSIVARTAVSAPSATLSFDCTDLGSSNSGNDKPITATAKHGTATLGTGTQVIHMGTGSWSNGQIGVTCRLTDSSGKCLDRIYVSMPSTASWSYSYISTSIGYQINCTAGGKTYTTTHAF